MKSIHDCKIKYNNILPKKRLQFFQHDNIGAENVYKKFFFIYYSVINTLINCTL